MHLHKLREVLFGNIVRDLLCDFFVVGMASKDTASDHIHPRFAVFDQTALECHPECITAAIDLRLTLRLQIILQRIPC